MPRLVGQVCTLRPLRAEDAETTLAWRQDFSTVLDVMGYRLPVTQLGEQAWYADALSGKQIGRASFAIDSQADELVGLTHLSGIDAINRSAEFGIVIAPDHRGQGYGKDACALLCGYGFDALNLNRIWLRVAARNSAASAIYEKLGFVREGVLRNASFRDGAFEDVVLMAALADEWRRN